ncbi:hypothetical protein [Bradyrhizobium sp.]|uniref:hypothetical protein n=1 Tax=Bradyrhizobium sp. TaxID=376 RepID=UPI00273287B0|nr:hypothetical protein [Bradyrhizobium sp.]MDP3074227.1 hypothetical protein [Bradyrhizobium sp.]
METMLTSGSGVWDAATAEEGSLHPARSGAIAANIKAMPADRLRNEVMKGRPKFEILRGSRFHGRGVAMTLRSIGGKVGHYCCNATRFAAAQCHTRYRIEKTVFYSSHWIVNRLRFRFTILGSTTPASNTPFII